MPREKGLPHPNPVSRLGNSTRVRLTFRSESRPAGSRKRLFADRVGGVFLVLAHVLHHFGVGEKFILQRERPGPAIGLGIVNSDFDVHVTEVAPAEAFNGVESFGMRTAAVIDPALVVETASVDHKPVAVPPADGIAEPGGVADRRMGTAIREDLAVTRELFIE